MEKTKPNRPAAFAPAAVAALAVTALAAGGCDAPLAGLTGSTSSAATAPAPQVARVDADPGTGGCSIQFVADVPAEVSGALARVHTDGRWVSTADYPQVVVARAGEVTRISASGLADRPDLEALLEARPDGSVLATLTARNATGRTVHVEGFELSVRPGEGGYVRFGDRPADSTLWIQGQASWNFAGTVEVTPGPVERDSMGGVVPDEELFTLGNNVLDVVKTIELFAAGRDAIPLSWWSVVIEEPDARRGLLAGALTAERFKTSLLVGHDPAVAATLPGGGTLGFTTFRIVSGLTGDRLPVDPGEEVASEQLVLGVHASGNAALAAHARGVADRMTVLPHAASTGAPLVGWSTWSCFYEKVDEQSFLDVARFTANVLRPRGFDVVQLDDGYEVGWGDWRANGKFPSGIDGVARAVKGMGLRPGIWIAPFLVDEGLPLVQQHPDWFLRDPQGNPIVFTLPPGTASPRKRPLDLTHPDAEAFARANLVALRAAGIEVFKTDFLFAAGYEGLHHDPRATGLSTFRKAMRLIRESVGPDCTVIAVHGPWLATAGQADYYRQSCDVETGFLGPTREFFDTAARSTAARSHVHGSWFRNDPDHLIVEPPVTLDAARLNATYVALCGGAYLLGDDVRTLAPDRLAIATHPDLLAIVRDGRSAVPVDQFRSPNPRAGVEPFVATLAGWFGVSSYTADAVPSVWKLERPGGTTVLAVFNWTGGRLQRSLTFDALGLRSVAYQARDVWIGATGAVSDRIDFDQPARSVTLLELTPR